MPVVATAGHVDHGKSTLIRALTGIETDRWEEEKRRGLTIDLGFAWTEVGGRTLGFVDVPGHERFLKNMLAGLEGIDAALFVVAADEGWKPQSEEHLAILDLLEVRSGVIALTKADLVDDDTLEIRQLEIGELLEGTSLASAPVVPVSVTSGAGIDEVRAALAESLGEDRDRDRPRLWVDRAFSARGAGTVVTGTLVGGSLTVDDQLVLLPEDRPLRVRGLQSHEQSVEVARPTNRVAVNISGVDGDQVHRGHMLGRPDDWRVTRRFLADLRTVRSLDDPVRDRGSFHIHVGSASMPAHIHLLEGPELDGAGSAVVTVESPLPLAWGDRIILREVGRRSVVAGGKVLDPHPHRRSRSARASVGPLRRVASPDEAASALLTARGQASLASLTADSSGGRVQPALSTSNDALSRNRFEELARAIGSETTRYHEANPLRAGVPRAALADRLGISLSLLDAIVDASDDLDRVEEVIRSAGFSADLGEAARTAWESAQSLLAAAGFSPPRRSELGLEDELFHALVRDGSLVVVSEDFAYLPGTLDEIRRSVGQLEGDFAVGDFRDHLGITRKHAVPLLEWMDREKITRRVGDLRQVRPRRPGG